MSDKSMGKFIAKLREEKGLTQKELADKLDVNERTVLKWEKDESCPDISLTPKLAETLGTSLEELVASKSPSQSMIKKISYIIDIILKALPVAMGAALIVSVVLNSYDIKSGFTMLGIGIFSSGLYLLKNE